MLQDWVCARGNNRNTAFIPCRPLLGKVQWESKAIGGFVETPVFCGAGSLYVATSSGASNLLGAVVMLDRNSGLTNGVFRLASKQTGAYALVLDNSDNSDGSETAYLPCTDEKVYARTNGLTKAVWECSRPWEIVRAGILSGDTLYFGSEGNVFALDKTTGQMRWRRGALSPFRCPPATDGESLFIGSRFGVLYALNTKNGVPRWKKQMPGMLDTCALTLEKQTLFFGVSKPAAAMAVDTRNGSPRWVTPLPMPYDDKVSSGALGEKGIYVLACGGTLFALHTALGRVRWSLPLSEEWLTAPVIGGDIAYTGDSKDLYAVNVHTGRVVWQIKVGTYGNPPSLSPDGHLYVPSEAATVVAIA